jgi:hypothetical protein
MMGHDIISWRGQAADAAAATDDEIRNYSFT